jgi:electron transport complex protein RnfC
VRRIHDFHGGIHPPENKHQSLTEDIRPAGIPPELVFPLSQHIGAPAKPVVQVGERVLKGQLLARPEGFISAAIHASTSGVIRAIENRPIPHPSALPAPCVVLASDGEDEWIAHRGIEDYSSLDRQELLRLIRDAGIAGMGGAGFPAAVKLASRPGAAQTQTLIINGTECEPYITADDILMRERAADIIRGAEILRYLVDPVETVIGVEDNKGVAAAALKGAARASGIEIAVFPTKYPSGGEKQLIEILTGKQVPSGGLPSDIGVVCQNIGTCYAVYRTVVHGEPLISRITTVTGRAASRPGNFEVLLGSPMGWVLEQAGFQPGLATRLVMGGPMMGFTVASPDVPVVKTTNCLLVPTEDELPTPPPPQPCIRCGLCAEACPASLLPQQLYWFARGKEYEKLEAHNLFDCIECGACSWVCPSNIPLVQYYRASKAEVLQLRRDHAKSEHSRTRFEARQERLEREAVELEERRRARKKAAEERIRQAASEKSESKADLIQAAIDRAKARKAAVAETGSATDSPAEAPAESPAESAAEMDAASAAIEKAKAARAAAAEQSPREKAESNLQRLRERLAKSEAKLQQSREAAAEAAIIEALENSIATLREKIDGAEQELARLEEEA